MNRLAALGVVAAVVLAAAATWALYFLLILVEAAGVLLEIIAQTLEVYP